jgi:2'-5' RNA ligase
MSDLCRCFIALDIDTGSKKKIREIRERHFKNDKNVKWVNPENAHFTLKFLGDRKASELNMIMTILQKINIAVITKNLTMDVSGAFPNNRNPQVLWIAPREAQDIKALYVDMENALATIGIRKERRDFHPHVTIGRLKSGAVKTLVSEKLKRTPDILPFNLQLDGLTFYKSTLKTDGPVYEKLFERKLP